MKIVLYGSLVFFLTSSIVVTAQPQTLQQLYQRIDNTFPDNSTGKIPPAEMRNRFKDIALLLYQRGTPDGQPMSRTQVRNIQASSKDPILQMVFVTDLRATFLYNPNDVATPDNGATTLVSSSGRRYERVIDGQLSVKVFGAKGDGKSDDTAPVQNALDYCNQKGIKAYFPVGVYKSRNLRINISSTGGSLFGNGRRFGITGESMAGTAIQAIGDTTKAALHITGTYDDHFELRNLRLVKANGNKTGVGLQLEKLVDFNIENVRVSYFNQNVRLVDANEGTITNLVSSWGQRGFWATTSGPILPNVIHLSGCAINSNSVFGAFFENGCANTLTACKFLGNGTMGSASSKALKIAYTGVNGRTGVLVEGCYFEGTAGDDIELQLFQGGAHTFIGNTFNKVDNSRYANTHIRLTPSIPAGKNIHTVVEMIGNSTFSNTPYKPSAGRPVIVASTANGYTDYQITDHNYYQNAVEKPVYDSRILVHGTRSVQGDSPESRTTFITNPNQLLPSGFYSIPPAANRNGGTMPPAYGLDNWHMIVVRLQSSSGAGNWSRQTITEIKTGLIFERIYTDDTGAWTTWKRLHTNNWFPVDEATPFQAGDLLYHDGTKFTPLRKGTNGQVLKIVGGMPAWSN
jgi:hypothetical protein